MGWCVRFRFCRVREKRVVVHVVNYDVDYDRDAVREKTHIRIRMPVGALATRDVKAELYAPGDGTADAADGDRQAETPCLASLSDWRSVPRSCSAVPACGRNNE